jgi:single-strand DNA-binding protein
MARHYNSVTLIGNLTREPELRYTPNDTAVAEFGLALNRSYQDSNGEWQEETDFVDITVWSKQAENASEYLDKGSKVFIEGRLDQQTWETDSGDRRSKVSVTANNLIFLDSQESGGKDFDDFDVDETESDIPF